MDSLILAQFTTLTISLSTKQLLQRMGPSYSKAQINSMLYNHLLKEGRVEKLENPNGAAPLWKAVGEETTDQDESDSDSDYSPGEEESEEEEEEKISTVAITTLSSPKDRMLLAASLLAHHGLSSLGWVVQMDQARRRGGVCDYRKKVISFSSIYLGVASDADFENTVKHEIAHGLTPGAKHGPVWIKKAREIGCDGKRCLDRAFTQGRFLVSCQTTSCSSRYMHRVTKRYHTGRCRKCNTGFTVTVGKLKILK
jgi:predicted SprT family Zn-dependent metalloprotease